MRGESYNSRKSTPVSAAGRKMVSQRNVIRDPRSMGKPCSSVKCSNNSQNKCLTVDEPARLQLFQSFWRNMDWGQKKVYVSSHVSVLVPKHKHTKNNNNISRRKTTFVYNLSVGGKKLKVCKQMFLSTLGIGERQMYSWLEKSTSCGIPCIEENETSEKVEKHNNKQIAKSFLEILPKMPSHYCRKSTTKLYLEPVFKSRTDLYNVFKSHCADSGESPVSRFTFDLVFEEMNLALYSPKKDQCDICCAHKVGNISDEDWKQHCIKKDRARQEKTDDKTESTSKHYVLTMDLESIKLSPMLKASAIYYKMKLGVHNFSVYDINSHHCTCYWWHECEGDLTASTFATCLIDYLEENCTEPVPIIVYSDGCTYQNRNAIISNALLHFSVKTNRPVYQKFLEKGHTQMECDSVHSSIECKLKNREIHLPSDYSTICKEARSKPGPYSSKYVTHDFFRDYSTSELCRYSSIRPGKKTGDPVVTNLRALMYDPSGVISYKLDFDDDWKELPTRPKPVTVTEFPALFNDKLKMKKRKWNDLQELKSVLPSDCHLFYDNLPYEND